ncbi:MAG: hypothetical protein AAFU73_12050 [Planctomycetota bacterium]
MKLSLLLPSIALFLGTSCASTFEPAEIEPTPQRPRISRNTKTTAKDSVELEAGISWDPNDYLDVPLLAKYGLADNTELSFEFSPLRNFDYPAPFDDDTGIGDLGFGVRHIFEAEPDAERRYGVEFFGKIPTSDNSDEVNQQGGEPGVGGRDPRTLVFGAVTGSTDLTAAGIVEQRVDEIDVVGYAALNAIGNGFAGTLYQLLLASHATMQITDADTAFVEIAWALTESAPDVSFVQGGVYRRVAGNMTADASIGVGLNADSPALFIMLGLSTNFGYVR